MCFRLFGHFSTHLSVSLAAFEFSFSPLGISLCHVFTILFEIIHWLPFMFTPLASVRRTVQSAVTIRPSINNWDVRKWLTNGGPVWMICACVYSKEFTWPEPQKPKLTNFQMETAVVRYVWAELLIGCVRYHQPTAFQYRINNTFTQSNIFQNRRRNQNKTPALIIEFYIWNTRTLCCIIHVISDHVSKSLK